MKLMSVVASPVRDFGALEPPVRFTSPASGIGGDGGVGAGTSRMQDDSIDGAGAEFLGPSIKLLSALDAVVGDGKRLPDVHPARGKGMGLSDGAKRRLPREGADEEDQELGDDWGGA